MHCVLSQKDICVHCRTALYNVTSGMHTVVEGKGAGRPAGSQKSGLAGAIARKSAKAPILASSADTFASNHVIIG